MKKTTLALLFLTSGYLAMAQDYSKVLTAYQVKKYDDAKKELDKLAAGKGKDKPETFMWQAALNSEFYADSAKYFATYPNAAQDAYAALMTYKQQDTSLKAMKEAGTINSIAYLYTNSFNKGKINFSQEKWQEAYTNFKLASAMGEFINVNGFSSSKSAIDTFTVLYTGYAAQNSGKPEEAVVSYEKLADLKIAGADLQPMYQYMLDDYQKLNQADKFKKYLAVAKELYPDKAALWSQFEMNQMTSGSSLPELMTKYKGETGALTEDQLVAYAEAFNDPEKMKALDSAQQVNIRLASADIYKKLYAIDPKGLYSYNAGVLTYNVFNVLDDRFYSLRGESAALKTQRADIQKMQISYADTSIYWLEKSYEVLKNKTDRDKNESNSLNRSVDFLANLYLWKRERSKGVAPKDYDKYDAKYNMYSDEHDKYKG